MPTLSEQPETIGQIKNTMLIDDMLKTSKRVEGLSGALKEHLAPILKANKLVLAPDESFEVIEDIIVIGAASEKRDYLLKVGADGMVTLEPFAE